MRRKKAKKMRKENQIKQYRAHTLCMVYIYILNTYIYIMIHEKHRDPNETQKYHYTTISQKTTNASHDNSD